MGAIELRDYQEDLIKKCGEALRQGYSRICLQSPTGSGKGVILPYLAGKLSSSGKNVLCMVHRKMLLEQLKNGIKRHEYDEDKVVIQGVASKKTLDWVPDYILVDEGHHMAMAGYKKVFKQYPNAKIIALTATPWRMDGKLGREVEILIQGPKIKDLIAQGYLADFSYLKPDISDQSEDMEVRGDDYTKKALSAWDIANRQIIVDNGVEEYLRYLNGKRAFAFTSTVEAAKEMAAIFCSKGIPAASVSGNDKPAEIKSRMAGFRRGIIKVLFSSELLGEGVDVPEANGVLMFRPTKSVVNFFQFIGRALRPKEDGSDAVILDFVGNWKNFKGLHPKNDIDWEKQLRGKDRKVPCVQCGLEEWSYNWDRFKKEPCPDPLLSDTHMKTAGVQTEVQCVHCGEKFPLSLWKSEKGADCPNNEAGHEGRKKKEPLKGKFTSWLPDVNMTKLTSDEAHKLAYENAGDLQKLQDIAEAKGYKPGWVYKLWQRNRK